MADLVQLLRFGPSLGENVFHHGLYELLQAICLHEVIHAHVHGNQRRLAPQRIDDLAHGLLLVILIRSLPSDSRAELPLVESSRRAIVDVHASFGLQDISGVVVPQRRHRHGCQPTATSAKLNARVSQGGIGAKRLARGASKGGGAMLRYQYEIIHPGECCFLLIEPKACGTQSYTISPNATELHIHSY